MPRPLNESPQASIESSVEWIDLTQFIEVARSDDRLVVLRWGGQPEGVTVAAKECVWVTGRIGNPGSPPRVIVLPSEGAVGAG